METPAPTRSKYVSLNRVIGTDIQIKGRVVEAIELVYEGMYLKHALAKTGLSRKMFMSALSGERELSQAYAQARKVSADFLVDEAIEAVATEENQMKARNIADMNRWAAGKFDAKYNDRIDINVHQTLDISGTLLEARQRMLRPVSDQQDVEDAQVIDLKAHMCGGPTDNQSITSAEPDIFAPIPYIRNEIAVAATNEPDIFASPARIENVLPSGEEEIDIFS